MSDELIREQVEADITERTNELRRFTRVFLGRGVVAFGVVVLLLFILVAFFAPLLAPYDPYEPDLFNVLSKPTKVHLLGTDALGRDILSRIIYGTRTSLSIGLIVVIAAGLMGMTLGLVAGYYGGSWVYLIIMRLIDAMMAFPMVLMALVIASLLGGVMATLSATITFFKPPPKRAAMTRAINTMGNAIIASINLIIIR